MITETLDDVMKRILNDPDIFYLEKSIFDNTGWKELGKEYQEGNREVLIRKIQHQIGSLKDELKSQRSSKGKRVVDKAIELAQSLKVAVDKKPRLLATMFCTLDRFGLVRCNLPSMEDYGRVIENHNRSTVEQFFLHKIDKAKGYKKKALRKALEYLKELYSMKLDILEIAFFFRKLNSLTEFTEVIKDG